VGNSTDKGAARRSHVAARRRALAGEPGVKGIRHLLQVICTLGVLLAPSAHAAEMVAAGLADLTLEQLSNIEVTSVSGRAERLSDAAASIFVITHDDIRRSGARTLPEALRLAPNLQVARTSASGYAISSRGFNNALGNKLLVLIDGRTVYTPLFSGVFWDQQNVMLEDIDRIEVISGPGATLWGANAVNGVINVITRAARDTQGVLATAGLGNRDQGAGFRYGGKLGEAGNFRVYGKSQEIQNTQSAAGVSLPDGWQTGQVGFRADWGRASRNFTVQGDAYSGKGENRPVVRPVAVSGMNLLARWKERLDSGSEFSLQAYYDRSERQDYNGFQGDVDTFDLEFKHGIPFGAHKFLWGGGYRHARDDIPGTLPVSPLISLVIAFAPPARTLTWKNLFVQDEIRLSEKLAFTVGLKLEGNDYTGWEKLPNVRLAWKPGDSQLAWGAVSRAVRAPARLDREFQLLAVGALIPPNFPPFIAGGPYFESEVANVFELGYRAQPTQSFSWSITGFHSRYDKLRSGMVPPNAFIENQIKGIENGVESWANLQATPAWRLSGGFSTLRQHLGVKPGSTDPVGPIALGNDPDHQWSLRSQLDITERHEFDVMLRRVGSLPVEAGLPVPGYTAVDARLGWRPTRAMEMSLVLENLFDREHAEFTTASQYGRAVFLKLVWRM
jgi:iron complex outermembrane receptor protein